MIGAITLLATAALAAEPPKPNVILLMMDGVRWQEVFHGTDQKLWLAPKINPFSFLTDGLARQGILIGDRNRGDEVTVANKALNSLPGYQSIMAGAVQKCSGNGCGRIRVETLQERLKRDLEVADVDVATIASWEKIANAVEHVPSSTFVNVGLAPVMDGETDDDLYRLNKEQSENIPPWGSARADRYTFAQAMRYLKIHRPRFLFISLNDSDEWGHKRDYAHYVETLKTYDSWIKEIAVTLDSMGEYGRSTTLIATTDHGRGLGVDWGEHGSGWQDSRYIWLYARSPNTRLSRAARGGAGPHALTHVDIRPTIESIFGLKPTPDETGKALAAVVGTPPSSPATGAATTAGRRDRIKWKNAAPSRAAPRD